MSFREETAVRIARRKAIREKINALSKKISEARKIITGLNECKRELQKNIEDWNSTYSSFKAVPIQADVVVTDVFEGVIAEALSTEIPTTAEIMNGTCSEMEALCGAIANQIQKLQEYITKLQQQIQSLYMELSAV